MTYPQVQQTRKRSFHQTPSSSLRGRVRRGVSALALGAFAVLSFPGAPISATEVTLRGMGVRNCQEWISERKGDATTVLSGKGQWVLGFLSGWSLESGDDLLDKTPPDAVFKGIDRICELKPLTDISEAARALAKQLK